MSESTLKQEPVKEEKKGLLKLLKSNLRDYAMFIVLAIIFIVFTITTQGTFLLPRNMSDLLNQTGYVAILAIGMTLILIIVNIDLSVGFVAGFTGAVAALLLQKGVNVWLTILICLLIGAAIGIYQGSLVAYLNVPAFVATLAGMFIFRGLLLLVTGSTGSIIITNDLFKGIAKYMPDIDSNSSFHLLTVILGAIGIVAIIIGQISDRKTKEKYDFKVGSVTSFVIRLSLLCALVGFFIYKLAKGRGLPISAAIVLVVLFIYNFILNRTKLGRNIYAIGGNIEAAALSGVNVKKVYMFVFVSMSTLASLAGIMYTSRIGSAAPSAGNGFEMDAIASSYIGGVAVSGGIGKVTNTMVGALVIMALTNGLTLMGVNSAYQYIAKGLIFILAVAFDVNSRKSAK